MSPAISARLAAFAGPALLAALAVWTSSSFWVWVLSGLETPLFAGLVAAIAWPLVATPVTRESLKTRISRVRRCRLRCRVEKRSCCPATSVPTRNTFSTGVPIS